jgi:1-acyl-sn-glycerol-3-phosphate acyltransferase
MEILLRKAHRLWLITWMILLYFLFWIPLHYFAANAKRQHHMICLRKWWAWLSSAMGGVFFRYTFEEPIDWSRTYVICPNHASNLDIQAMSILLGHTNCCFMGKENLVDGLLTGVYFRTIDMPVNRDSKIGAFKAFKKAAEKLQSGINMIMFPEGGIADVYPPTVSDFKNGPFRLAIELKIPIIPVTSLNTWKVFWDDGAIVWQPPRYMRCIMYINRLKRRI